MGVHVGNSARVRRRAVGAAAVVALGSLVVGIDAGAQQEPPDDGALSVQEVLTPARRITDDKAPSSALAQTDRRLLRRNDAQPVEVAIKLDYDAVAVYAGGLQGFEATSPLVTGVPLSERPAAAQRYELHVAGQEAAFVDALRAAVPSAQIGTRLRTVYGGIAATIPANAVETVLAIPGAVAVQKNALRQPLTDSSPEFVNADDVYDALGTTENAGEGVILGNLDTGIWPEHPSFADLGNLKPPSGPARECNYGDNPLTPAVDVFVCQNKLIGGAHFTDTYDRIFGDDPLEGTARDGEGHGTHTSSTSAGNIVTDVPVLGRDLADIHGLAPGAWVMEYKVCGPQGCFGVDSAAAVQQAILDGVDVINFSISGGTNPFTDPAELAFLDAYAAGVFVSASAGNEGPGAGTANHLSPWVTTVAASTQARRWTSTLTLSAGAASTSILGTSVDPAGVTTPTAVRRAETVPGYTDASCLTAPPSNTTFAGLIVACVRTPGRVTKSFNVLQGGGVGMVLYNAANDSFPEMSDTHWVPTIHIQDGPSFLAFLAANPAALATISPGNPAPYQADVIVGFSSRGPGGNFIKPDVTAPGVQILAGDTPFPPQDPVNGPPGEIFQAIGGTSMSSPHVAGAALLVRAVHPDWTPGQIKSALMTTAITDVVKEDYVTPADPFDFGSGRIDIGAATEAPLTFSDTAANFFTMANDPVNAVHLNIPSVNAPVMPGRLVTTRTATNATDQRQRFDVSADAPIGSTVSVTPSRFGLNPGQSQELTIIIESDAPIGEQQFGSIQLVERGGASLHLPVAFVHTQGGVNLTQACDPTEIRQRETSTCTVEAANNTFDEQTVDLDTFVSNNLRITDVEGADLVDNRHVRLHDVTLAGASPGVPSHADGDTPAGGYLGLEEFGVPPTPIGDEEIIQLNTPPFDYNGQAWTTLGVDSNGYLIAGETSAAEDNECCNLPDGPDPARPNNMIAPLWTDLDGSDATGVRFTVLTDGVDDWIVVQWNVEVFGTEQAENFQIWLGLNNDTNPDQDISWAYAPGSPTAPTGLDFLVGVENLLGEGEMAAVLPTGPQVVTSTDFVPGDTTGYTLDVTGNRPGGGRVTTEMTASLVPGTTIVRTNITVVPRS
jgi:Subtilase family/Fibronectin type-III domain